MDIKVSVIIPVYKVEKYIEKCVLSLFNQTLDKLEYIFIDDKTPDKSIQIVKDVLKNFPHRQPYVKIIEMPRNSKVAAARNAGMRIAKGEYMIHCDPDDWLELDAYENMYRMAIENNADIVQCKYFEHKEGKDAKISKFETNGIGKELLKNFKFTNQLWSLLIKTCIIKNNQIYPFLGINYGEDLNIVIRAFYFAKAVVTLNKPLYHYNIHSSNATSNGLSQHFFTDLCPNINLISEFLDSRKEDFSELIKRLKYREKNYLIFEPTRIDTSLALKWYNIWPETNKLLFANHHKYINFILSSRFIMPYILPIYMKWLKKRLK